MKTPGHPHALSFPSSEVVATLRDVTVTFDSFASRAVNAVNMQIKRGEVVGLVGPKQSGKSTILRLLAGQLRPTDGNVKLFGRSFWRWSIRSHLGYLPQRKDHIRTMGFIGCAKNLSKLFQRQTNESESIPQTTRISLLGRLLIKGPPLLLLDEPFSQLDPESCQEVKARITSLAQQGKTVVISSSSLSEVCGLCSRLVILHRGEIQAAGTLDELLASTDAIRITGPVLPQPTAERVLKTIQEDLRKSISSPENQQALRTNERQLTTFVDAGPCASVADKFLAPLAVPPTRQGSLSDSATTPAKDSVDHSRLAELVRPITK